MSQLKKIKVLVVDDHPVVQAGISAIVDTQTDMEVVAEACNGTQAIAAFEEYLPDITLMDLRLEDMSGVECIRAIRKRFQSGHFIVLTTYRGDEDIHQSLKAGANGYIVKGMPRQLLVEAIRKVHSGETFLPSQVKEVLDGRNAEPALSRREREVLSLVAAGKCNKEIATELGISEATVKCHLTVIFLRLSVTDRTQAVLRAMQRGLVHV